MRIHRNSKEGFARTPAKGSKRRDTLLLALRPCGVSIWEVSRSQFRWLIGPENETGWDIRIVGKVLGNSKPRNVARVVGYEKWSGRYRDLTGVSRS